ncbi:uncharacterized protein LOC124167168 [Ischnura elegans]|uniref:uncharacterized protein LOC124167168 n=1 Tax=Ischnura elegans TaxID=197161 RepID=UPI001ED8A269|nr:uncharacterized protein LOC124167168 [Ischnura elegans]
MASTSTKYRHYTVLERKVFLDILGKNKKIEDKKGDGATLREKEDAWRKITQMYNTSSVITQERTVAQLKKWWSNIKQHQRSALTTEKQNKMKTGGGRPPKSPEIDPEVHCIVPDLMATAPTIFTSNMAPEEIAEKADFVADDVGEGDEAISTDMNEMVVEILDTHSGDTSSDQAPASSTIEGKEKGYPKTELALKRERYRRLMKYDAELAMVRLKTEKELGCIQIRHANIMNELQVRAATAKAELEELLLQKEKNKV